MARGGRGDVGRRVARVDQRAAVFVYLSEVEADGRVRYVTEGVLRALHRREAPAPRFERRT